MKEILKSKMMILLVIFMLCVFSIAANENTKKVSAEDTNNRITLQK